MDHEILSLISTTTLRMQKDTTGLKVRPVVSLQFL